MTKGAKRRIRQNELTGRESFVITASVVVLGVVVLICAGMLVAPLWTAAVEAWRFRPSGQECSMLKDGVTRRACYEELSAQASRHPVKGANAPPIPPPSGQRSE